MQGIKKTIAKIAMLSLILPLIIPGSNASAAGRLTEFQDILSRIKRSGAGAETNGYTLSTAAVRSKFIFADGVNDELCIDTGYDGSVTTDPLTLDNIYNDALTSNTCTWADGGEILVDIIDDGGATEGTSYTGPEVAAFIKIGIESALRTDVDATAGEAYPDLDDSYTVTYKETSTNTFTFAPNVNEDLWVDLDGGGLAGDSVIDIIADSAGSTDNRILANTAYTGAQVAAALQEILNNLAVTGDDAFTVTYSTVDNTFDIANTNTTGNGITLDVDDARSTAALYLGYTSDVTIASSNAESDVPAGYINRFEIRGDGGNTLDPVLRWSYDGAASASSTLGYSTDADVAPLFSFYDNTNEDIYWDPDGTAPADADTVADLISDGGLIEGVLYDGDQVATAIEAALDATSALTATVTWSAANRQFSIQTSGDSSIEWTSENSSAADALGYTADSGNINGVADVSDDAIDQRGLRSVSDVSDSEVQFIVIDGTNDQFELDLDGSSLAGTETIDLVPANDGSVLALLAVGANTVGLTGTLQNAINTQWSTANTVTVTYTVLDRFQIESDTPGTESLVNVESAVSGDDFLPTIDLLNDVSIGGQTTNVIVSAYHTLSFRTENAVPASGQVEITFPEGFVVPETMGVTDVDFATGATLDAVTDRTLAPTAGAGAASAVGLSIDTTDRVFTFTLNNADNIPAGHYVEIEIGRNAAFGGNGTEEIINPTTPGMFQIQAETKEAVTLTFTDGVNEEIVWDPDGLNNFVFADGVNEEICFDTAADGLDGAGCTTDDDVLVDIIDDSAAAADTVYTGLQVAGFLKDALEAQNGTADTYTVTYNSTTETFTIEMESGSTEISVLWSDDTTTAGRMFGFINDDVNLNTVGVWESDIIAGTFVIDIVDMADDSGTTYAISNYPITSGSAYSPDHVVGALDEILELTNSGGASTPGDFKFPSDGAQTYTVNHDPGTGIITIAEDTVTDGQEPIFYWTWDSEYEASITAAGYTLGFTSDDTILEDGFSLDSDITSVRKQIDIAYTSVYFVDNDQITLTAGVDPNLEMEINGGLASASVEGDRDTLGVDFGSLEPNSYYKLGGAKTEFGSVTVRLDCNAAGTPGAGDLACIPATDETVTIRGTVYTFKRVAADAATGDTLVYASVTGSTQIERAAKLLTNLYRAINSSDANVRSNPDRVQSNRLWVLSAREGADTNFSLVDGTTGKLTLATTDGVNSYFYQHNEALYDTDPSNYQTSLAGLSDFRGHNIKVNTNAADGYTLQLRDEGPDVTSPFRSWSDAADLGFGIYGYSQSTRWGDAGNTAAGDDLVAEAFQGGETNNNDPQGLSTEYQTIARNDVATARDNIALEYVLRIDADQPAGNYQNTIDILVSAQY